MSADITPRVELPLLLRYEVIDAVPWPGTLARLCLVSKLCRYAAESRLYRSFILVGHYTNDFCFTLDCVSPFFRLPSLTTFQVHACGGMDEFHHPVGVSSVTDIDLMCSILEAQEISLLIGVCKALRSFRFQYGCVTIWPDIEAEIEHLDLVAIGTALRHHKHSLEVLRIDDMDNEYIRNSPPSGAIGSLKDFEKLVSLDLEQHYLLGPVEVGSGREPETSDSSGNGAEPVNGQTINANQQIRLLDLLPPSLEALVLRDCDVTIVPQLCDIYARGSRQLPNLKRIGIDGTICPHPEHAEMVDGRYTRYDTDSAEFLSAMCVLQLVFGEAGIELNSDE